MTLWPCRSRALPLAVLAAGLAYVPSQSAIAMAGSLAAPNDAAAQPPIQAPEAAAPQTPAEAPAEGAAPAESAPEAPAEPGSVPEAPASEETATPDSAPGETGSPPGAAAEAAEGEIAPPPGDAGDEAAPSDAPEESEPAIDPSLLEAETGSNPPKTSAPKTLRTEVQDEGARDAAVRKMYQTRYRPENNPARLNVVVRGMFANAGGREKVGGRMGGAQVDIGQTWNHIGYAGTVSAWGGRVFLPERTGAEMNALLGVGPTASLGRLALVSRGYLDVRAGYDFYYGVVNRRRDDPTIVASQSDPDGVVLEQTDNLAPHGPRLSLSMGFLGGDSSRRYFHGFGVTMGWQALVGSFRGDLPFTNMLTLGFSYWLG